MEIGAANVSSYKTTEPLVAMVDSLATTVEKLATKLAKIEARHDPRPPPTTIGRYMPTPGSENRNVRFGQLNIVRTEKVVIADIFNQ